MADVWGRGCGRPQYGLVYSGFRWLGRLHTHTVGSIPTIVVVRVAIFLPLGEWVTFTEAHRFPPIP